MLHQYAQTASVTAMLLHLHWETLRHLRIKLTLALMFKILNWHMTIPPEKYFHIKSTRSPRCQHSQKIIQATTLSDYYSATFFIATILRCNEALAGLVEAVSLEVFRGELAKLRLSLKPICFYPFLVSGFILTYTLLYTFYSTVSFLLVGSFN